MEPTLRHVVKEQLEPVYMTGSHWEAFDGVARHLTDGRGPVVVHACRSSGRTTFLQRLERRLRREMPCAIINAESLQDTTDFASAFLEGAGLHVTGNPETRLLHLCEEAAREGQPLAALIDNAEHLPDTVIALITRLQSFVSIPCGIIPQDAPIFQPLFITTPSASAKIIRAASGCLPVRGQTFTAQTFYLTPFSAEETGAYLRLRLGGGAGASVEVIHEPAVVLAAGLTHGLPKKLRVLANYLALQLRRGGMPLDTDAVTRALGAACEADPSFVQKPKGYFKAPPSASNQTWLQRLLQPFNHFINKRLYSNDPV